MPRSTHAMRAAAAAIFAATLCFGPVPAMAAKTIELTGKGVSIVAAQNSAQADGSTSQTWTVKFVQENLDGEYKGQTWGGECVGMGLVTADGTYSGVSRCSVDVTADDGYTFELKDNAEGGDWVVTSGKGMFKGATGGGHTSYVWGDTVFGDKIAWTSTGTLVLP